MNSCELQGNRLAERSKGNELIEVRRRCSVKKCEGNELQGLAAAMGCKEKSSKGKARHRKAMERRGYDTIGAAARRQSRARPSTEQQSSGIDSTEQQRLGAAVMCKGVATRSGAKQRKSTAGKGKGKVEL